MVSGSLFPHVIGSRPCLPFVWSLFFYVCGYLLAVEICVCGNFVNERGSFAMSGGVLLMVICSSTQGALHCTDLGYSVRCLCMSMQEDCGAWPGVGL